MKASPPNDDRDPRLDDNDPVWHLLARAPRQEPDAWFAVRTLARCRHVGLMAESRAISFHRVWRWALGGGLGLSLAAFVLTAHFHSAPSHSQKNVQEAFEIMASLGTDSDSSSSSWQDSSL